MYFPIPRRKSLPDSSACRDIMFSIPLVLTITACPPNAWLNGMKKSAQTCCPEAFSAPNACRQSGNTKRNLKACWSAWALVWTGIWNTGQSPTYPGKSHKNPFWNWPNPGKPTERNPRYCGVRNAGHPLPRQNWRQKNARPSFTISTFLQR